MQCPFTPQHIYLERCRFGLIPSSGVYTMYGRVCTTTGKELGEGFWPGDSIFFAFASTKQSKEVRRMNLLQWGRMKTFEMRMPMA